LGLSFVAASLVPAAAKVTARNASAASEIVSTFVVEADAKVYEDAPTYNAGRSSSLYTNGGAEPDTESYVRVTVNGLGGVPSRALLRLYATSSTKDGPFVTLTSDDWAEKEITWNNRPAATGGVLADSGVIDSSTWVEWDVTTAVRGNGTYAFRLATGSDDGVDFASRERGGGLEPRLVVLTSSGTPAPSGSDTVAPSAPTELRTAGTSATSLSVAWRASTDNVGVAGYRTYLNGAATGTTSGTTYVFAGLLCGTSYTIDVEAYDAAGNRSPAARLLASTLACSASSPSTSPPSAVWPTNPYPLGSLWNPVQALAESARVDPNSSAYVSRFLSNMGTPLFTLRRYGTAVAVATSSDPLYSVPCTKYSCNVMRFGSIPIPAGTKPDPGGDGHLAILDYASGREWGFWQASYDPSTDRWSASSGHAISFSELSVPPSVAGLNDANFPGVAGIVTPEELASGEIRHPLVFQTPARGSGAPRCPATVNSGSGSGGIVNGMWFQLDPSVNVDALPLKRWEKAIARALQRYGMFVRDGASGTTDLIGENPINRGSDKWNLVKNDDGSQAFSSTAKYAYFSSGFPWSKLRVLAAPC
jgi:hypothetical protein